MWKEYGEGRENREPPPEEYTDQKTENKEQDKEEEKFFNETKKEEEEIGEGRREIVDGGEGWDEEVEEFFDEMEEDVAEKPEEEPGHIEGSESREEDEEVEEFFDETEREEAEEEAEEGRREIVDGGEGWDEEVEEFFDEMEKDVAEKPEEEPERIDEGSACREGGGEEGKQGVLGGGEKMEEGGLEPKQEGGDDKEDSDGRGSLDPQFVVSWECGERKTPDGGWEQYRVDSAAVRSEKTKTSVERTSVFSRGETPEEEKIVGFVEGLEAEARVRIDSSRFDDIFVRVRSIEQIQSIETHRPVDLSLVKFPEGEPVKEGICIHSDSELKDVRMVGKTAEFWRDAEGLPHMRTTRWLLLQTERGENRGETPKVDWDKTQLFGYLKIKELCLFKGRIDRKETFTWFSQASSELGRGMKGEGGASRVEGEAKTGGMLQGLKFLFGNRENDVERHDYRVKHEVTELVYLPTESDTSKTIMASSVVENVEKNSNDKAIENVGESFGKTETLEVETSEEVVKGTVVESSEETAEKTVEELDQKTVGVVDGETAEILEDSAEKTGEAIGEAKTSEGRAEKSPEVVVEGEERVLVEVEDGERVSSDNILRMVIEGAFKFGGEEEYYKKAQERGVRLDAEKLEKMLFVERRIPKEVYMVLESLQRESEGGKSDDGSASRLKAEIESSTGFISESVERGSEENTEETELEPLAREHLEEGKLSFEDIFTVVKNTLRGIMYSVSKEEFFKLYSELVKRMGGEEKVAELLRRMKVGEAKAELLYNMVKNNEVSLEVFGAFLKFLEGAEGVEGKVREIVQKTIKLFRRIWGNLLQEQEIGAQDLKVLEEGGSGVASVEELRRRGYAYLGQLIGRYLGREGLVDDWIFDLIMMYAKESSQDGSEKAKDVVESFREVWEGLGMDSKFKLSSLVREIYELLGRRDLLLFVYDGRVDPYGRRGRVVSKVDALEILCEAVREAGGETNFLEVVSRRSGRRFYQYSVDGQLVEGRLDEEILRVAVEYVYKKREKIDERWKLLEVNTDYILKRLMEEAFFFSYLEGLLEPLVKLDRRVEQFGLTKREDHLIERVERLEGALPFLNMEPQNMTEVGQDVEKVELPLADKVIFSYDLTQENLMPSIYEHSGVWWREVLDNPYTTFLFPDMVEYAREVNKNLPNDQKKGLISPIILTPLKTFGLESASIGAVMLRLFQSAHWPEPLRAFIDQKLADYMNLPKLTDLKIHDNWFEKVIDASRMILDMTTGQLLLIDDFENPTGVKYWGVDVFISIVVPVGSGGCFLKVSVSIKNDKTSCDKRVAQLNMRDSNGKYVLSNESLYRCGWAVLKNHNLPDGDGPGQLWETWNSETGQGNVELLIDRTTGRILKYMIPDMTTLKSTKNEDGTDKVKGFADGELYGADNIDRVMIVIPQEGALQAGSNVENRRWKGWVESHNGMAYACFLFENLERINPIKTVMRVHVVDYLQGVESVAGFHRCLWKPRATMRKYGTITYEPMRQKGIGVFDDYPLLLYLIRDLGLSSRIPEYKAKISVCPPSGEIIVPMVKSILNLFNGGFALSAINPYRTHRAMDWMTVADFVYQNFVKLELDVMTRLDRKASERVSYLSLFFDAVQDYGTDKVYTGRYIDYMLLSPSHSLFGTGVANTEFFVIPRNTIKEQPKDAQGNFIPASKWDHTKRSLAIFVDHNPYSSQLQTSLIAIPVFKSGSGLTQLTPINTFYKRHHDRYVAIPIENREELFYSNVEYYLLYNFDPSDKENPYKPYQNPKLPLTNIFAPNELKIGGLNEIIKFLEIIERICQSTTSYSNTGDPGYERSPPAFLKQLAGFIMSYPKHGLEIFDKLGGFEAMNKVRQFYPLHPLTNNMQEGLVAHEDLFREPIDIINKCNAIINNPKVPEVKKKKAKARKKTVQKTLDRNIAAHPEAWAFYQILPHNEWIPANINAFIFLLSIVGAERVGGNSCIPMKWYGSDDNGFFAFSIKNEVKEKEEGVAIFKPNAFKDLDKLGYPMKIVRDENNKPVLTKYGKYELTYFFKDSLLGERKTFVELNLEEIEQVVAINLHHYKKDATPFVSPYLIRKVFGGKIKINGIPLVELPVSDKPEENCLDWHKAVTKCETIPSIRGSGRPKVTYAFSKFLVDMLLELNLDSVKDSQFRFELINLAIEKFYKKIPTEIIKMWEAHTQKNKNLKIIRSIQQLFIILDMTNAVTEPAVTQKVGQKDKKSGNNTFYINLINKISNAPKTSNLYKNTSIILKEALNYITHEMHKNPNSAFQAFMLRNIIKLGSVANTIESLKPDNTLHGEAKTLWTKQLSMIMKEKIKTASENLKKYTLGFTTVKSLYGQELVAMLQYEGCSKEQISHITGFTLTEVKQLIQKWKTRCNKEKIDEFTAQEKFMSALDKLCRRPTSNCSQNSSQM